MAGVGPKRAAALQERGITTVADALYHLPSRYEDWRDRRPCGQLLPEETVAIGGELTRVKEGPMRGKRWRRMVSAWLQASDGSRLRAVWFNLPGYARGMIRNHERIIAFGKVQRDPDGVLELIHPEIHRLSDGLPPQIRPHYRLPDEVGQRLFRTIVGDGLSAAAGQLTAAIPAQLRAENELPSPRETLAQLHQPASDVDIAALQAGETAAHRTLALDEMFAFQLALLIERGRAKRRAGLALRGDGRRLTGRFIERLPFQPTGAQQRAIREIETDLACPRQMNRILIGDVGSGKTLVAFWAALRALESGYQVMMMAPTELLAEQHHRSFARLCSELGVRHFLLTASTAGKNRAEALSALAAGEPAIVFGTQALIQESVHPAALGLAIVDEQHRFGVFDRARLKALGVRADMLLLTATPVPRSLALTVLANLDVSVLDEMPRGRTMVSTALFNDDELAAVDEQVRAELEAGHRAFYIVPLIDADDPESAPTVDATVTRLRDASLRNFKVGAIHGRLPPASKERVMREFRDGRIDVLVSTTVVEVGIDVPEATVIVVLAAERYGLAQLHQLRGRVGRGSAPSRCLLVVSRDAGAAANQRLQVMVSTSNGADLARADLEARGPGDIFGSRQTGALPLRFARFIRDVSLIEQARRLAAQWLRRDPALESDASAGARIAVRKMLALGVNLSDVG